MLAFHAPQAPPALRQPRTRRHTTRCALASPTDADSLKRALLRLGATSDRGQLHNSLVWGDAYAPERTRAAALVASLEATPGGSPAELLDGQWELVYASAPLFVSSPFFLAVAAAFNDPAKSALFYKLHELQVASWGISRYGRVEQTVDLANGSLTSSFTTLLFGLTVLPIIGWWKLLPTFGGRVVSVARNVTLKGTQLGMELDITRAEPAEGVAMMPFVGRFLVNRDTPVGAVWRLLPWNGGRPALASLRCSYVDEEMRVMRDADGGFFVYARCEA